MYWASSVSKLHEKLGSWYRKNHRQLPWRQTKDPYHIWLSEVILQQTRTEQGRAYYHRFLAAYPTIQDLSAANEDEVLALWQGLGYYSRGRNLLKTAQQITTLYGGHFPQDEKIVGSLPGIGPYTTAAILSFAFDLPLATVDGNVYRVLSRLGAEPTEIDSTAGKKLFADLAYKLLDKENPAQHNNAMMELGATVCLASSPRCTACPIELFCLARKLGTEESFPRKSPKRALRERYFHFVEINDPERDQTLMARRPAGDIWQGLYQPLLIETTKNASTEDIISEIHETLATHLRYTGQTKELTHILTHQRLTARLYRFDILSVDTKVAPPDPYHWVAKEEGERLARPQLVLKLSELPNQLDIWSNEDER